MLQIDKVSSQDFNNVICKIMTILFRFQYVNIMLCYMQHEARAW